MSILQGSIMAITAARLNELAEIVVNEASDDENPNYLLSLMVLDEETAYDDTSVIE
jgi:hypothetical protein